MLKQEKNKRNIASIFLPESLDVNFESGDKVQVQLVKGEKNFSFDAYVSEQETEESRILLLTPLEEHKNTNILQRKHIRVPVVVKAKSIIETGEKEGLQINGTILDISCGGVKCMLHEYLEKDSDLTLKFPLVFRKDTKEMKLYSRVVYCRKAEGSIYVAGVKFLNPGTQAEDTIARFVFEKMSEERKRKKGDRSGYV